MYLVRNNIHCAGICLVHNLRPGTCNKHVKTVTEIMIDIWSEMTHLILGKILYECYILYVLSLKSFCLYLVRIDMGLC